MTTEIQPQQIWKYKFEQDKFAEIVKISDDIVYFQLIGQKGRPKLASMKIEELPGIYSLFSDPSQQIEPDASETALLNFKNQYAPLLKEPDIQDVQLIRKPNGKVDWIGQYKEQPVLKQSKPKPIESKPKAKPVAKKLAKKDVSKSKHWKTAEKIAIGLFKVVRFFVFLGLAIVKQTFKFLFALLGIKGIIK